ncbi:MAG: undecaprenyl-phosphate glucose phosphotransferase [Prevotellaceae bacterium]|nr:undecaprenyl-phosphate glucose phosphotransferase [Prevotellaceae bacterium]
MINEKYIQIFIFVTEAVLLTLFTIGYYFIFLWIDPKLLTGVENLFEIVVEYIAGFTISFMFFPTITQQRFVKAEQITMRVIKTCFMMFLLITFLTLLFRPYSYFPRRFIVSSVSIFAVILLINRFCIRRYLKYIRMKRLNQKSVILIGNNASIYKLYDILTIPIYGYNIVATFYDGECTHDGIKSHRRGGTGDIYAWIADRTDVGEVYAYIPKEQHDHINMISKFCDNHLIRFFYLPDIDVFKGNMAFSMIEGLPVVARREEPLRNPMNRFIKRVFDIVFSLLVLILIFPWIFIWVAIMIKQQSPGPIFFCQERNGLDGTVFKCLKFRSMKENDEADTVQATKDDPRKFPFGDFIRKTNIDELPQFINVLKGEMSVVGPRPHMLKHTKDYSKLINNFMVRHFAKPGITGLAQVSGFRGETRYIEQMQGRVKKDIEYIENWTFLLDIKIIVKTIINMFGKEKGNAY